MDPQTNPPPPPSSGAFPPLPPNPAPVGNSPPLVPGAFPPLSPDLNSPINPPPPAAPASNDPKQQIVERLKGSVNVLVTVSTNPSVDQLSAAIGFTLVLNKLKKHGTAVFSGEIPSTIEFLQPEKTIEKNTDSLRDFIVSLDKSKADKLRYKVEDKFVKIFITPYHASLSEKDLEFGQGDLNVDVIIALGVGKRDELDQAITAHGRILHDATVVSITKHPGEDIGTINWHVPEASSYSEILVGISDALKSPETELFDQQIATAFLTGIVAETDRFSNDKTTPQTMNMSAILMRAGANQQLIANKLEEPEPLPEVAEIPKKAPVVPTPPPPPPVSTDGALTIPHEEKTPPEEAEEEIKTTENIDIDDDGKLHRLSEETDKSDKSEKSNDLTLPPVQPEGGLSDTGSVVDQDDKTLEEIERAVGSHHLIEDGTLVKDDKPAVPPDVTGLTETVPKEEMPHEDLPHISEEEAREKVEEAEEAAGPIISPDNPNAPVARLNSVPVDLDMGHSDQPASDPAASDKPPSEDSPKPDSTPPPPSAPPWTPPSAP